MTVIHLNSASVCTGGTALPEILRVAKESARVENLPYAGSVTAQDAWRLFIGGHAHLIDVRSTEERESYGFVPNTLHIAWQDGPTLQKNPRFVCELGIALPKNALILLLCKSGRRSAFAAAQATAAGFTNVFNVEGGIDGDINNPSGHSGWHQRGLPWVRF